MLSDPLRFESEESALHSPTALMPGQVRQCGKLDVAANN